MFAGVLIATFLLMASFASCPMFTYLKDKRRYDRVIGRKLTILIVYYLVVLACIVSLVLAIILQFTHSSGWLIRMTSAIVSIGFITLIFASLSGPFVALDLISMLKEVGSKLCNRCGYNLTGNTSGVCPECGTNIATKSKPAASMRPRLKAIPWRRFIPLYLAVVFLLAALLGYMSVTTAWVCSECGRCELRVLHRISVPFHGLIIFEMTGGIREGGQSPNPLIKILDPDNDCQHNWVGFGSSGEGITDGWRGIGVNPSSMGWLADTTDLDAFVAAHPDVVERIRSDLRNHRSVRDWIGDEYRRWKDDPKGTLSPP